MTTSEAEPAYLTSTRAAYDTIAADYAAHFRDAPIPALERAIHGAFAELVLAAGGGQVLEAGSGPGEVTARLRGLGLDISGIDLSPRMVEVARQAHPGIRFDVGSMTALDLPGGALAGLVAWYSLIHIPAGEVAGVLTEFRRVVAPEGYLLVAFQVGDEPLHRATAFGHEIALDFRRLRPEQVATQLREAGFVVVGELVRETGRRGEGPAGLPAGPRRYR